MASEGIGEGIKIAVASVVKIAEQMLAAHGIPLDGVDFNDLEIQSTDVADQTVSSPDAITEDQIIRESEDMPSVVIEETTVLGETIHPGDTVELTEKELDPESGEWVSRTVTGEVTYITEDPETGIWLSVQTTEGVTAVHVQNITAI